MNIVGFILDDTPREWRQLPMSVFLPALTIALSWALIRWKRSLAGVAFACAVVSGYVIIHYFRDTLAWLKPYQRYTPAYHSAVWFSALLPLVMVVVFYFSIKRRPNKSVETTRGTQP